MSPSPPVPTSTVRRERTKTSRTRKAIKRRELWRDLGQKYLRGKATYVVLGAFLGLFAAQLLSWLSLPKAKFIGEIMKIGVHGTPSVGQSNVVIGMWLVNDGSPSIAESFTLYVNSPRLNLGPYNAIAMVGQTISDGNHQLVARFNPEASLTFRTREPFSHNARPEGHLLYLVDAENKYLTTDDVTFTVVFHDSWGREHKVSKNRASMACEFDNRKPTTKNCERLRWPDASDPYEHSGDVLGFIVGLANKARAVLAQEVPGE